MANRTFLQLCQNMRSEAGISGTGPSTVLGQSGMYERVVNWVRKATKSIQQIHWNWEFLWAQSTIVVNESTPGTFDRDLVHALPIKQVDKDSFWCFNPAQGEEHEWRLRYYEYEDFRRIFEQGVPQITRPTAVTIMPNNTIRLNVQPDLAYHVKLDYYKQPDSLTNNTDVPTIPEEYEDIILYRALMDYARYENAPEILQSAMFEYNTLLASMERDYLPDAVLPIVPFA